MLSNGSSPAGESSSSSSAAASSSSDDQPITSFVLSIATTLLPRPPSHRRRSLIQRPFLPLLLTLLLISALLLSCPAAIGAAAAGANRDEQQEGNSVTHNELAAYDNEIISEPEIECGPGVVRFNVKTRKGNASAVYVRGQSQNTDCTFHNTRNITIELGKCNVRRKREVNPNPGIAYQMTVVVQLHPLFVTKVDRAYNVNCFYREQKQDVSVDFGVNELVTQQILNDAVLPNCTYSVHRDSPNGPRVKYTHVGEQLYHVWSCPSEMYAMLLYNCNAVDGKGDEYPIVDANGCSRDEFLMPQITYTEDRTKAMAASSAFNFPDRNTMLFTCKIKLCMLKDEGCSNLTPPSCNGKRAKSAANGNFNVDNTSAGDGAGLVGTTSTIRRSSTTMTTPVRTPIGGRAGRTEISGEVAEAEFEAGSSPATASTASTTEEREVATTSSSTPPPPQTTTATPLTPAATSSTTSSSSSTAPISTTLSSISSMTSTSTTTKSSSSTTTEEQLLSSVERATSSESTEGGTMASHGNKPSSSASPSLSSSGTTNSLPEATSTHKHVAGGEVPADFPRPDLLLQRDQLKEGEVRKRAERMERLGEGADGSWTISTSTEEVGKEKSAGGNGGAEVDSEDDGFRGTTKPVQVFKKSSRVEPGGGGGGGNDANSKAGRAQRDTVPGGMSSGARRRMASEVDFDIQSPELMIMDDYEPAAAAQKAPNERSSVQEAPFIVDWANGNNNAPRAHSAGVCFSPAALICAGALLLVLMLAVIVALFKATRMKGAGGNLDHSFYSH